MTFVRQALPLLVLALVTPLGCGDVIGNVIVPGNSGGSGGQASCAEASAGCGEQGTPGACLSATECPSGVPLCDPKSNTCVECLTSRDCGDKRPFCHPARHECVACLTDTDCKDSEHCIASVERCAASCENGQACPSEASLCDASLQICVSCRTNADCTDPEEPDCLNGECMDCSTGKCH